MTLAVSIVSHGHGLQVCRLLSLLAATSAGCVQRVWLTVNCPDPALEHWLSQGEATSTGGLPFDLQVIRNNAIQGFAANHNQAFERDRQTTRPGDWFCVMNPDIEWQTNPFPALLAAGNDPEVACVYPVQLTTEGRRQDHQRALVTPGALFRRRVLGQRGDPADVDWVCGAFMMLRSAEFSRVGGFDVGYFMYCEDVDLCLRLQLGGGVLREAPGTGVVHAARRRSGVDVPHLWWHVRSLIRLWRSPAYLRYRSGQRVPGG